LKLSFKSKQVTCYKIFFRQVISYNKYTGPYATHTNGELVFFDQNRTRCEVQMAGYQRECFRDFNSFSSISGVARPKFFWGNKFGRRTIFYFRL